MMFTSNIDMYKGQYICVSNVHTTVYAYENISYRLVQNDSLLALADGAPLSIVGKLKGHKKMERITGLDFMELIFKISEEKGYSHYFYGNRESVLMSMERGLREKYPNLRIAGCEPSLYRELSAEEINDLAARINQAKPSFLWVGLGAPRQEYFCSIMKEHVSAVMAGVGGAFNILAGTIPRAPGWMQRLSMEWLFRLVMEPGRLWRRYFVYNTKFIYYLLFGET